MDKIQCSVQYIHYLAVYCSWGDLLDDLNLLNLNFISVIHKYSLSASRKTPWRPTI